jgi:hypothetical protein
MRLGTTSLSVTKPGRRRRRASGSATPTYSMSSAANNINEGSSLSLTVTTQNVANTTVLYWGVTENPGDFTVSTGTVTITANTGSFNVTPTADNTTEGAETFTVKLYTDSARTNEVASVSNLTINDTSEDPAARYWQFYFHAYGAHIQPVYLYWVVGNTATLLATYAANGQTHSSSGAAWFLRSINMAQYAGQTGRFAYVAKEPTGLRGDFALDGMAYTSSSNVTTVYDGRTATNRDKWRGHINSGYSTATTAATTLPLATHKIDTPSTSSNPVRLNCWCYDPNGGTGTGSTGPDNAANDNDATDYIYYEATTLSNYTRGTYYRALMLYDTITLD